MRKVTFLLSLFLVMALGVSAQRITSIGAEVTDASSFSAEKRYAIQVVVCHTANDGTGEEVTDGTQYLCYSGGKRFTMGDITLNDASSKNYICTITPVDGGINIAVNGGSIKWFPTGDKESGFGAATPAGVYELSAYDNGFMLRGNDGGAWLNYNTTNGVWVAYAEERAMRVKVYELEIEQPKTVVFNYNDGANTFSASHEAYVGTELSTALDYFKDFSPATVTVTDEISAVDVTCTPDYPFTEGQFCNLLCRAAGGGNRNVAFVAADNVSTRSDRTDYANYWYFKRVPDTQNQFYLYNAATMGALAVASDANETVGAFSAIPSAFRIVKNRNGGFHIRHITNDNANLNDVEGQLKFWTTSNSIGDGGSNFTVAPVEDVTPIEVAYLFDDGKPAPGSFAGYSAAGVMPNLENISGLDYYSNLSGTGGTVTAENPVVTVSCESSFPFEISTAETPVWQLLKTRDSEDGYLVRSSDNAILTGRNGEYPSRFTAENVTTYDHFNNGLWRFQRTGLNAFKLYNKESGKAVAVASAGDGVKAALTDGGTELFVSANGEGFNLQVPGAAACCLGDHINAGATEQAGYLGTWNSSWATTDDGSRFTVKAADSEDIVAIGLQALQNDLAATSAYVGGYTPEAVASLASASAGITTVAGLDGATATLDANADNLVKVSTDKIYTLTFKRGTSVVGLYDAYADKDGNIGDEDAPRHVVTAVNGTGLNTLWQFEAVAGEEGAYNVRSVNTPAFKLGTPQSGRLYVSKYTDGYASYSVVDGNSNMEKGLKNNGAQGENIYLNCFYNPGLNNSTEIGLYKYAWSGDAFDAGNILYIKEVTSVPLSISAAGWATLNLPFAVALPEGVKAYYVSNVTSDALALTEIEQVIPANTPVLLEGEEGDYVLALTTGGQDLSAENRLSGTTVERRGMEAETYYGLGNLSEGVAFYLAASTEVPANKAFLPASELPSGAAAASALRFSFDGGTTGLRDDALAAPEAATEYYDLSGRRVFYPTRGIYVTGEGQKVFIK